MTVLAGPDKALVLSTPLEGAVVGTALAASAEGQSAVKVEVEGCACGAGVVGDDEVDRNAFACLNRDLACVSLTLLHELICDRVRRIVDGRARRRAGRSGARRRAGRRARRRAGSGGIIARITDRDNQRLDLIADRAVCTGDAALCQGGLVDQLLRLNDLAVCISLIIGIENRVGVVVRLVVEVDLVLAVRQICGQVDGRGCERILVCVRCAGIPGGNCVVDDIHVIVGQVFRRTCLDPCAVCVSVHLRRVGNALVVHPHQVPCFCLEGRVAVGSLTGSTGVAPAVAFQQTGIEAVRICKLRIRQRDAVVAPQILVLRFLAGIADMLLAFLGLIVLTRDIGLLAVLDDQNLVVRFRIFRSTLAERCFAVHSELH